MMRTMRAGSILAVLSAVAVLAACDSDATAPDGEVRLAYDFNGGAQGWAAGFADYPAGREQDLQLSSGLAPLPAPLDASRRGFRISGLNSSDDLFMYLTRRVDGLEPNQRYRVGYVIDLATNAPRGCVGVGGAPGESVYVKAGAAPVQPVGSVDGDGFVRLNVDYGEQSQEGQHARVLGNVATANTDCTQHAYAMKTLRTTQPLEVQAAADGSVWLVVGTDSGYESTTTLFYTRIEAALTPVG